MEKMAGSCFLIGFGKNSMSIAFKEWALVCAALGSGQQSIILRKGGIAEGRAGFRFEHEEFFLFPTLFHEQAARLKLPVETSLPPGSPDWVKIEYFARVEWSATLTDLAVAQRLAPFHLWRDEVIEERFHYDEKEDLHLAFVRVLRVTPTWTFPNATKYGGCRSWVTLPEAPVEAATQPVISDAENKQRSDELRRIAGLD